MSQPFVGEIRILTYNFTVAGWAECNGQLLPISQNETLFQLSGTTYGGDGQSTFALPDLRGREAIHQGTGGGATYSVGESGGVSQVTLTTGQVPAHTHAAGASSQTGDQRGPLGNVWAAAAVNRYGAGQSNLQLSPQAVETVGGGQAHDNMPPYLALNFQISLFGIFPSQN